MATVSEKLAKEIIANGGYYADDPQVLQVVKYENAFGSESWALLYAQDVATNRYRPTEYVRNPKVIWSAADQSPTERMWPPIMWKD